MPGSEPRPRHRRDGGLTHVIDKGLGPRGWEDVLETRRRLHRHRQARLGHRLRHAEPRAEARACSRDKPVVIGGTFFEVVYARDKLDEYKRWLSDARPHARRDLRRHRRDPARAQARADRRLRARLHRPLRGRLEGLRGRVRAVPVGRVDQGGARRRRLEGDHRGARGRHRRHLPPGRRDAHRADRRDRARDRLPRPRSSRRRRRPRRRGSSSSSAPRSTSATSRPRR